jgi:hypothetical protein
MLIHDDSIQHLYPPPLRTPVNLMQRFALWRARRELKFQYARHVRLVARDLQVLNHWAFHAYHEQGARFQVYRLKADFLQCLYINGFVDRIEPEQQIIKCNSCVGGVWHPGAWNEETCFRCNGTGIHKRILLYKFTVGAPCEDIVFHLPANHCAWLAAEHQYQGETNDLPRYRRFDDPPRPMTEWQFQKRLLRVAYLIECVRLFDNITFLSLRGALRHDERVIAARVKMRCKKFVCALEWNWTKLKYRFQKEKLPF